MSNAIKHNWSKVSGERLRYYALTLLKHNQPKLFLRRGIGYLPIMIGIIGIN